MTVINLLTHIPTTLAADPQDSSGFWNWFFGLKKLDITNPDNIIDWQYKLPAYMWILIVIGIGLLVALSYRHMLGRRAGRVSLAVTRSLILLAIAILLARPIVVHPDTEERKDRVRILIDQSKSMTVLDAPSTSEKPTKISRFDQMSRSIIDNRSMWTSLRADAHELEWFGFGERVIEVDPERLTTPIGETTAMDSALRRMARSSDGAPIAAVVVFSDGHSKESIRESTFKLFDPRTRIFVVPLGSAVEPAYIDFAHIDAPPDAFVKDVVPIDVSLNQLGGSEEARRNARIPAGTFIRLVDKTTGKVLDEKPVKSLTDPVRLMHIPTVPGEVKWSVELVFPDSYKQEKKVEPRELAINLDARPLNVLYIDGYPRWEFRYIKNMIIRESTITATTWLASADREFAQEGNARLDRLPQTKDEFKKYDIIILGDIGATYFSSTQLKLIQEHVDENNAGLIWVAGERHTPNSYTGHAFSALLPMNLTGVINRIPPPVKMKPTSSAQALGVLRLRTDTESNAADANWPTGPAGQNLLPDLEWAQAFDKKDLKPATDVLAEDRNTSLPLIMRMQYGGGQVLYIATDETWRWRYARGELFPEQFWMQLFRLAARGRAEKKRGAQNRVNFRLSHKKVRVGQNVSVRLEVLDQKLIRSTLSTVDVEFTRVTDDPPSNIKQDVYRQTISLQSNSKPGLYQQDFIPRVPGKFIARVISPTYQSLSLERELVVESIDDEMTVTYTKFDDLADIADRANGRVLLNQKDFDTQLTPVLREAYTAKNNGADFDTFSEQYVTAFDLDTTNEVQLERNKDLARQAFDAQDDGQTLDEFRTKFADNFGNTLGIGRLANLNQYVDKLTEVTANDVKEPIWNSRLAFFLILLLITGEWIGRKLLGLA